MTAQKNNTDTAKVIKDGLIVLSAITGDLKRNNNTKLFSKKMGVEWNLDDVMAQEFVKMVEVKFRRKAKTHAFFDAKGADEMPAILNKYIAKKASFLNLASVIMDRLEHEANALTSLSLSGGRVVFIHYKESEVDTDAGKFFSVMVKDKSGFEFDGDLRPKNLSTIDIDALMQAALFDLFLYKKDYPSEAGSPYIHFIEGSQKSQFFKAALGCSAVVNNRDSVNNIFKALADFMDQNKIKKPVRDKIRKAVDDVIENAVNSTVPEVRLVKVSDVEEAVDRALPKRHPCKGKFKRFINENSFDVNDVFEPHGTTFKNARRVSITGDNNSFEAKVSPNAIGFDGEDKPATLNKAMTHITFRLDAESRETVRVSVGEK